MEDTQAMFSFWYAFGLAILMVWGIASEIQAKGLHYARKQNIFWRFLCVYILCCVELYLNE